MNGEIYDLCKLTLHANQALQNGTEFVPLGKDYIAERRFVFSSGFGFAKTPEEWFRVSRRRGLTAVRLLMPVKVKDRGLLGFSNASRAYLALFRSDGTASCVIPNWSFDKEKKAWNVLYRETEWEDAPKTLPVFTDETEAFKSALHEISALAEKIGEPGFAECFESSVKVLEGYPFAEARDVFPELAEPYHRILNAASKADVFGAMGSWNDAPPYEAEKKGLKDEYDRLSDALLRQIRINLMYAVNTCYS